MIVRAYRSHYGRYVELLVRDGDKVGVSVEMKEMPDMEHEATVRIPTEEAQALMDDLWLAGLRPTEGSGSAGSLAATERHLADMRKIAFGQLRMDK